MVKVRFIAASGAERELDVEPGTSVMMAGTTAAIEGALGDCGGNMSCGTCHCHIAPEWRARIADPSEAELMMLDCVLDVTDDSRLGCQIKIRPELEGMVVRVPEFKL